MGDDIVASERTDDEGPVVFETEAERLRWLPITLISTSGRLRLQGGRLSFRTLVRKKVVFDIPVGELHSAAGMSSLGMHVWHGSTRYRLSIGSPVYLPSAGDSAVGVAVDAASIPGRLAHDRRNRDDTGRWLTLLQAAQGPPPPDVRVRRPWPGWTWGVGVVLATLVIIGGVVVVTLLAS